VTAIGGRPNPEISCRGVWGERACTKSVTVIQSMVGDRKSNFPAERRALYHWINAAPN